MNVTMEQVEKVRACTGATFEQARAALEQCGGSVLDAVILLERTGGAGHYSTRPDGPEPGGESRRRPTGRDVREAARKLMQNCTAVRLDVDTGSGVVDFSGKLKEADVETSSGAVSLAGLGEGGVAEVETASGSVTIHFIGKPKSINVDAVSGDIKLILPQGTPLDLDYDTASGDLIGKPLYLGSGDVPVQVETASGDLKIEGN